MEGTHLECHSERRNDVGLIPRGLVCKAGVKIDEMRHLKAEKDGVRFDKLKTFLF